MKIECVAGINADYYSISGDRRLGTTYTYDKADLLMQKIKENHITDIEIVRGRNVFANRPLDDSEFDRMVKRLEEV